MRNILFVLVAVLSIFVSDAFASKAVSKPMNITLQDGRQVTVVLCGDEHFSFYVSSSGELIIREGNLWHVASDVELKEAEEAFEKASQLRTGEGVHGSTFFPHFGNPKALVILASFSDCDFVYSRDDFDKLFNSTEYREELGRFSYSSLAQFMNDCSEGQFRPEFDVVGPYKLSGTLQYYGQNSGSSKDIHTTEFLQEVCAAADVDVDFSQYDADGDGLVDLVYVVSAGFGENMGAGEEYLWPKSGAWSLGTYDGVTVYRFGINTELFANETIVDGNGKPYMNGIGVLAHEFCHTLGLPDVYPTVNWSDVTMYDNQSMEYWDIMDGGENNYNGYYPTPLTAFERELFGWIKVDTLNTPADIEMQPLLNAGKAYRIMNDNDATGNEYYILEAIPSGEGTGWYRKMRGEGLLVTHIEYNANLFTLGNCPNNVYGHPRWTIVPADGIIMTSYRRQLDESDEDYISSSGFYSDLAGDTYPGTLNVTELMEYKAYSGIIDKPITEISQDGFSISFKFMGGSEAAAIKTINANIDYAGTYNLQGQKVSDDYKGIIILNGKKILR